MNKSPIDLVAWILLIVGGLNWLLYGVAGMDLVKMLVGGFPPVDTIVYALVGLSALYMLYQLLTKK